MKLNKILIVLSIFGLNFLFVAKTFAICPVCTAAVVAGLGLSRWLGVDDTVSGLWIGAILVSICVMTINWLRAKKINHWWIDILIFIFTYGIVVIPLYLMDVVGHPLNILWGIDKLVLGIAIGSIALIAGFWLYLFIKKSNNNKPHFAYEKIVFSVLPIIILSIIFYFITKH